MGSPEYNAAIYPPKGVKRRTVAEVVYGLSAPESKEGGSITFPVECGISRGPQIINDIREKDAPIGTMEPNYWKLDGSFVIPIPADEQSAFEYGFWSDEVSNGDGYFYNEVPEPWDDLEPWDDTEPWHDFIEVPAPIVIERTFDSIQTFSTLGIYFDSASGNCCSDFDIEYYDGLGNLLNGAPEIIMGNQQTRFHTETGAIGALRVVIKLRRTNQPYRRARITELDFGLTVTFQDRDILSLNLINETDIKGKAFVSPAFHLSIYNRGDYGLFDPDSYAQYFLQRQQFQYKHGLVLSDGTTEWVNCGSYYLTDWKISDTKVEFTANGSTYEMEGTFFESSLQEYTFAQLVAAIDPQANTSLDSPPIAGYFGNVDLKTAQTYLTELSCCLVYEDRDNITQYFDVIEADVSLDHVWDDSEPWHDDERWLLYNTVDQLDYNNIIGKPAVRTSEYYNAINLSEYDVSIEEKQISKTQQVPGAIMIVFSSPIIIDADDMPIISVPDGFTITDVIWRSMYLTATLTGDGGAEVIVTGRSVTLSKTENIYYAPWHTGKETARVYKIDLPFFIKTSPSYEEMKEWFLQRKFEILRMQFVFEAAWRGNPERNVADFINVVFNNRSDEQPVFIVREELNYSGGALSGSVTAVGNNPLLVRGG